MVFVSGFFNGKARCPFLPNPAESPPDTLILGFRKHPSLKINPVRVLFFGLELAVPAMREFSPVSQSAARMKMVWQCFPCRPLASAILLVAGLHFLPLAFSLRDAIIPSAPGWLTLPRFLRPTQKNPHQHTNKNKKHQKPQPPPPPQTKTPPTHQTHKHKTPQNNFLLDPGRF